MKSCFGFILISFTVFRVTDSYAVDKVKYVDLGLPSGTLWAECNVGAKNAWDTGHYIAWGETAPKNEYTWENYKYCKCTNGVWKGMTKYGANKEFGADGYTDELKQLDPVDDVTYTTYGCECSMPTKDDWRELFDNCHWEWTDNYKGKGQKGCIIYRVKTQEDKVGSDKKSQVYAIEDTHIFLPAGGGRRETGTSGRGTIGYYWANSVVDYCQNNGEGFYFMSGKVGAYCDQRYLGFSVRAVKKSKPSNKVK